MAVIDEDRTRVRVNRDHKYRKYRKYPCILRRTVI